MNRTKGSDLKIIDNTNRRKKVLMNALDGNLQLIQTLDNGYEYKISYFLKIGTKEFPVKDRPAGEAKFNRIHSIVEDIREISRQKEVAQRG